MQQTLQYQIVATAIGHMLLATLQGKVCALQFSDKAADLVPKLQLDFPKAILQAANFGHELFGWTAHLQQYLQRSAPCPQLPLIWFGTPWQQQVWHYLCGMASGTTISYTGLAAALDRPKAARAVAAACAANKIALLVPCHRVIRQNGELAGYRWGKECKEYLLALENVVAQT